MKIVFESDTSFKNYRQKLKEIRLGRMHAWKGENQRIWTKAP